MEGTKIGVKERLAYGFGDLDCSDPDYYHAVLPSGSGV